MPMNRRIGRIAIAALGFGLAGCDMLSRNQSAPAEPPRDRVRALGRVEPAGGVIHLAAPPGARIEAIRVKAGDRVERGQELIALDNQAVSKLELELLDAQIDNAKKQVELAREASVLAKQEIEQERQRLDQTERIEQVAQQKRIESLNTVRATAESTLAKLRGLQNSGAVNQSQVTAQELETVKARAEYDAANALLEKAKKERQLADKSIALRLEQADQEGRKAELLAQVGPLEIQRKLAAEKVRQATVVAPIDGQVLSVEAQPGEVATNMPLLRLGETREMAVSAEVDEFDIALVQAGQPVNVIIPQLGRKALKGTVAAKDLIVAANALMSLDPTAEARRRVVKVQINLEEDREAANLTGMQVEVEILVAAADRVAER